MKKYFAAAICLALFISIIGCSKSNKKISNQNSADSTSDSVDKALKSIELFELSATIFEDLEAQFEDSSMSLTSLQKNKKGTLIEAKIAQIDPESKVPQAILLLSENFKRLHEIRILVGNKETPYTMQIDQLTELSENNENDDLLSAIWNNMNPNPIVSSTDKPDDDPTQSAGV